MENEIIKKKVLLEYIPNTLKELIGEDEVIDRIPV